MSIAFGKRRSSKSRKRRSPAEARAEILDAAEELLLETGPGDLKLKAIADRCGQRVSNVHHHFGGIADLHEALAERVIGRLVDEVQTTLLENVHAKETRLKAIDLVASVLNKPAYAKFIAWMVLSHDKAKLMQMIGRLSMVRQLIASHVKDRFPEVDAEEVTYAIIQQTICLAIGEGLVGDLLHDVLSDGKPVAGSSADRNMVAMSAVLDEFYGVSLRSLDKKQGS